MRKKAKLIIIIILALFFCCDFVYKAISKIEIKDGIVSSSKIDLDNIPNYNGDSSIVINGGETFFTDEEKNSVKGEIYSELDTLGRARTAMTLINEQSMPTEKRGSIGMIKPSGWHTIKYDIVDGKYLYNRCHLIAYQLSGENANEKNLITCTRYMNNTGMITYENEVANYIKTSHQSVLYRVTPIYIGDNLVASGAEIEAYSMEDNGAGINFNVYVYNVQPGIYINYLNGNSELKSNDN